MKMSDWRMTALWLVAGYTVPDSVVLLRDADGALDVVSAASS
jgi:hypothetical protein